MKAILKRELKSYFNSPLIYVILGVFVILTAVNFINSNVMGRVPELNGMFFFITILQLFFIPVITMRLFTEENTMKTDQLLLTAPVSITSIVFAKLISAFLIYAIMIAFTFLYAIIIASIGTFVFSEYFVLVIGSLLMGLAAISLGMFVSSIFKNTIITTIVSFGALGITFLADMLAGINVPFMQAVFGFFSMLKRYSSFAMGVISPGDVIYYLSFCAVFVFLTIRVIDKKRWE